MDIHLNYEDLAQPFAEAETPSDLCRIIELLKESGVDVYAGGEETKTVYNNYRVVMTETEAYVEILLEAE